MLLRLLVWLLSLFTVTCKESYHVAWQAPQGPESVFNISNYTFEWLGEQLDVDFHVTPYLTDVALSRASQVDFLYAGPTTMYCEILLLGLQPLTTVINNNAGQAYNSLSGAIIAKNTSGITTFAQLQGKVVGAGQLTTLSTFQAELYALNQANFSLFTQVKAVVGYSSSPAIVRAVMNEDIDVGFIESSQLVVQQMQGLDTSGLSVVQGMRQNNTPFLSSTIAYSSSALAAAAYINNTFRTSVVKTLLSLQSDNPVCVAGGYSGWAIPQSFLNIRLLMQNTGLLNITGSQCNDLSYLYSFVVCPAGYYRQSSVELMSSCDAIGFACPPNSTLCVCSPCRLIPSPKMVGALALHTFVGILCALVVALAMLAYLTFIIIRVHSVIIPYEELHIEDKEVGRSIKGRVLLGRYKNLPIAVKRALPCTSCRLSIFDHDDMPGRMGCVEAPTWWIGWLHDKTLNAWWHVNVLSREHRLMLQIKKACLIRHPHVLPVLGCSLGEHGDEILVVTAYAETGTLLDLITNQTFVMDRDEQLTVAQDVARGMAHLHCLIPPVYNRNLRSHQIMLDSDTRAKIGVSFSPFKRRSMWNPPEVMRGGPQTDKSNVYKYGMLLYEIVNRKPPFTFQSMPEQQMIDGLLNSDMANMADLLPKLVHKHPLNAVMQKCWAYEPSERPSFEGVCAHLDEVAPADMRRRRSSVDRQLLDSILPPNMAQALKEGRPVEPEHHESCSIFFSDVVGFTAISSLLKPSGVVNMLGRLYTAFEALVTKYDLYKIETIGDAFMCCSNIQRSHHSDHAVRLVRFALEALEVARTIPIDLDNISAGKIRIRCGIHSGKCVATVIGQQAPRYCLFGDCVNVASRMESNSAPNRLNISEECRRLIGQQDSSLLSCVYRRPDRIDVKGKGRMKCYWVMREKEAQARGFTQNALSSHSDSVDESQTLTEVMVQALTDKTGH